MQGSIKEDLTSVRDHASTAADSRHKAEQQLQALQSDADALNQELAAVQVSTELLNALRDFAVDDRGLHQQLFCAEQSPKHVIPTHLA